MAKRKAPSSDGPNAASPARMAGKAEDQPTTVTMSRTPETCTPVRSAARLVGSARIASVLHARRSRDTLPPSDLGDLLPDQAVSLHPVCVRDDGCGRRRHLSGPARGVITICGALRQ